MKFFIDNNLSPQMARGMAGFGEEVTHLQDSFEPDEADNVWLAFVGKHGWFMVSRDDRIRRRPAELDALKKCRVGAFFLGGKNRSRCELIQQLVRNWPRMKELAVTTKRPFAFRIPPTGSSIDRIGL